MRTITLRMGTYEEVVSYYKGFIRELTTVDETPNIGEYYVTQNTGIQFQLNNTGLEPENEVAKIIYFKRIDDVLNFSVYMDMVWIVNSSDQIAYESNFEGEWKNV